MRHPTFHYQYNFEPIPIEKVPTDILDNIIKIISWENIGGTGLLKTTLKDIQYIKRFYDEYVYLFFSQSRHAYIFVYEYQAWGCQQVCPYENLEDCRKFEKKFIQRCETDKDNPKYKILWESEFPEYPYPLCKDCKYFIGDSDHTFLGFKTKYYYVFSTCKLTQRFQNDTKHITSRYKIEDQCRSCRADKNNCGPEGKFFEHK